MTTLAKALKIVQSKGNVQYLYVWCRVDDRLFELEIDDSFGYKPFDAMQAGFPSDVVFMFGQDAKFDLDYKDVEKIDLHQHGVQVKELNGK